MAMYSNIRQYTVICLHLKYNLGQSGTVITYTVTAGRKEGEVRIWMFELYKLQDASSSHFLKYSQVSLEYVALEYATPNASRIWVRGEYIIDFILVTRRS